MIKKRSISEFSSLSFLLKYPLPKILKALAAAQCLTMRAPHGLRRSRENGFVVPHSFQIMPSNIYTKECPFYHPEEILNKFLHDNHEVFVELVHHVEIDDYGAPILSKWAFIAFKLSDEHSEERASKLLEDEISSSLRYSDFTYGIHESLIGL